MNPAEIMAHQPLPAWLPTLPIRSGHGKTCGDKADAIVKAYARRNGFSVEEIMSKSRLFRIAHARQGAMYELYMTGDYSYPSIATYFDCDHTSVYHAVRSHAARLRAEAEKAAA